jgi:short-subunit dehydrogenase
MAVNYFGVRNTAVKFLPLLRANHGRLLNIGSIAGTISGPFSQPYSVTKHAVRSLSDSLRHELKPLGVSVSRIEPGFVKTNILGYGSEESSFHRISHEKRKVYEKELNRALAAMIPMAEMASTTDETDVAIVHAMTSVRPQPVYHPGTVGGLPAKIAGFVFKFLEAVDPSWVDALMDLIATLGEYGVM